MSTSFSTSNSKYFHALLPQHGDDSGWCGWWGWLGGRGAQGGLDVLWVLYVYDVFLVPTIHGSLANWLTYGCKPVKRRSILFQLENAFHFLRDLICF